MNKKILMLLVVLTISVSVIVGCSKASEQEALEPSESIMPSEVMEENSFGKNQHGDLRSSGITDPYVNPEVKFSNLTSEEDQSELMRDLGKAGIKESYIKDYINYVNLYNETAPESVLDGWNTLDKVNYDPYEINDVWVQKYPDFVGVCCRMAAFT
ncbi:MAG: DUF4300 family protein, partial [Clostridia bacterium]|nr:DUF4300 family protein [Clostridia bacterium]